PLSVVFTVLLDSIFIGDEITTGRQLVRHNSGDCWALHFPISKIKRSAGQIDLASRKQSSCSRRSYKFYTCIQEYYYFNSYVRDRMIGFFS
uniref:Uncharacterized protein n=1 Tax=Aegilops tauschii subsp. strangulata TaxID=200361 RepID=A0A453QQE3_AEGTS